MVRTTTNANYTAPNENFPQASEASDPFKKEDVQWLALAVLNHNHSPGHGLPVSNVASGAYIDRPVSGTPGDLYISLTGAQTGVFYWDGSTWQAVGASQAPYIQEFTIGVGGMTLGGNSITLSNIPTTILLMARNGVIQSQVAADWSWTAGSNAVTFSDVFIATDRIVVAYAQNFGGANAATVNGFPAVPASAPAANSLVATDSGGLLPMGIMPAGMATDAEVAAAIAAATSTTSFADIALLDAQLSYRSFI